MTQLDEVQIDSNRAAADQPGETNQYTRCVFTCEWPATSAGGSRETAAGLLEAPNATASSATIQVHNQVNQT
jgi:hypothetical protein